MLNQYFWAGRVTSPHYLFFKLVNLYFYLDLFQWPDLNGLFWMNLKVKSIQKISHQIFLKL